MLHIAIFVSGSGTNCENIIRHFANNKDVKIALVLSNRADAYALTRAQNHGVPTVVVDKDVFNNAERLLPILQSHQIDFIVLAGFLWMIPSFLIQQYPRHIINIHPALLPLYGGKGMYGHHVHEAVKKAGEKQTGITIHFVNEVCDGGEMIAQYTTPLSPNDSCEDIANKVHTLEQQYFPQIIERVLQSTFNLKR